MSWRDRPVALIIGREVRARTRRRSFTLMLAISALAIVAIVVIPGLSSGREVAKVGVLAGAPPFTVDAVHAGAVSARAEIDVATFADEGSLRAAVDAGTVALGVGAHGSVVVKHPVRAGDSSTEAVLSQTLREALRVREGLAEVGLSPSQTTAALAAPVPELTVLRPNDTVDAGRIGTAVTVNMLLFVLLQIYGSWVLTGVTEEKSSRVVEVLLATVKPWQLLTGKVAGIGLVALIHGAVLLATALIAGTVTDASFLRQIDVSALPVALVWLLLGYALYCLVFAAVGSRVSRSEEAQSMAFPVLIPILVAYIIGFGAIFADTVPAYYRVLAWLPPTSPVAMPVLAIAGRVAWWEVGGSMVVMVVAIVAMARLAARIYEGSILRTGDKVTWRSALQSSGLDG